ncbi:hypothetical protein [Rathayibacter sp. VKM Ac-2927]|uniref:terminase small subunit n=1 Tax=Rathayibacter sp. VKM Ac-2927 TaxID=2929478 RepID=UPI001FB3CA6C|nr:hypothetical protein [Rathayibacter sp. VKM Ac-2927]MCJ1687775.1 hypothetical protein [Rathayibacter sp. VKM Ac-2927]
MAQTPDQRREAARERMREKRRREREQRDAERAAAANGTNAAAARVMRDSVDSAIAAAKWLKESDAASIAQARLLAEDVDVSLAEGDRPAARAAHRALSRVLSDLGATPSVRLLRELRSLRFVPDSAGGSDGGSQPDAAEGPSNVSKFQRPEKRAR